MRRDCLSQRIFGASVRTSAPDSVTATLSSMRIPPNQDFIKGTADMKKSWDAHPDLGAKTLALKTIEAEEHGDTAIEMGEYDLGQGLDRGKYMIIWKCVDGTWKMHRDMWNSSLPAPE